MNVLAYPSKPAPPAELATLALLSPHCVPPPTAMTPASVGLVPTRPARARAPSTPVERTEPTPKVMCVKQASWARRLFSKRRRKRDKSKNGGFDRSRTARSVPSPGLHSSDPTPLRPNRARPRSTNMLTQWSPAPSPMKRPPGHYGPDTFLSDASFSLPPRALPYSGLATKFCWEVCPSPRGITCCRQSPSIQLDRRTRVPPSPHIEQLEIDIIADYFSHPLLDTQYGRGHLLQRRLDGLLTIRLPWGVCHMLPSSIRLKHKPLTRFDLRPRLAVTEPTERSWIAAVRVAQMHRKAFVQRQTMRRRIRMMRRLQRRICHRVPRQELLYMSSKAVVLQEYQALFQLLDGHTCAVKKDKNDVTGVWHAGERHFIHLEQHSDDSITGEYVTRQHFGQERRLALYGSYKGRQLVLNRADDGTADVHRNSFQKHLEIFGSADSNGSFPEIEPPQRGFPWQSARGRVGPYNLSGRLYFTHPTFHGGRVFAHNIVKAERKIVLRVVAGTRLLKLSVPENCSISHLKTTLGVRLGLSQRQMRHCCLAYRGQILTNRRPEFYRLYVTDGEDEVSGDSFAKINSDTACIRMLKKIMKVHREKHAPPALPDDDMKQDDIALKYDEQTRSYRKESFFTLANNAHSIVLKNALRITFDQSLSSIRHYSRWPQPDSHESGSRSGSGTRSSTDLVKSILDRRRGSSGTISPGPRRSTAGSDSRKPSFQRLRKSTGTSTSSPVDSEAPRRKQWTVDFRNIAKDKMAVMLFMENVNLISGERRPSRGEARAAAGILVDSADVFTTPLMNAPRQNYMIVSPSAKSMKLTFQLPKAGSAKKKHKMTMYIFRRHEANVSTSCAYGRIASNANLYNTPKSLGLEQGDELFCHWWKLGALVATCRSQGLRDGAHVCVVTRSDTSSERILKAFHKRAKRDEVKVYVTYEGGEEGRKPKHHPVRISRHNLVRDLLEAALKVYDVPAAAGPHLRLGRKKLDPFKELRFYEVSDGAKISLATKSARPAPPQREIELPSGAKVSLCAPRDYSPVESYCCENILKCSITFTLDSIDAKIESIIYDEDFA